jgi:AAA domain
MLCARKASTGQRSGAGPDVEVISKPDRLTVHINPDHFLQTTAGRITTPERSAEAWTQCFAALDEALDAADLATRVYVLVGPQGSGKSTWARQRAADEPNAILFDAILVKRSERSPILTKARDRGIPAIAVWFRTPLDVCLARNAARPADEVAAEQGIRNVYAAVEAPTQSEGFAEIIEVADADG